MPQQPKTANEHAAAVEGQAAEKFGASDAPSSGEGRPESWRRGSFAGKAIFGRLAAARLVALRSPSRYHPRRADAPDSQPPLKSGIWLRNAKKRKRKWAGVAGDLLGMTMFEH